MTLLSRFLKPLTLGLALAFMLLTLIACSKSKTEPVVLFKTTQGDITIQLHPDYAPKTVELFLQHVDAGFYSDIIFHRVIPNFMAQTGGFKEGFARKEPLGKVVNESYDGLPNLKGSVAMARTNDPDSASSQFYINVADNLNLNSRNGRAGYTVFGTVTSGVEVAVNITELPRGNHIRTGHKDAPNDTVTILSASRAEPAAAIIFEQQPPKSQ